MASEPLNKWVNVGRFRLIEHKLKVGCITIMCDVEPDGSGEGGTFDEKELEKVIGEFYAKHF